MSILYRFILLVVLTGMVAGCQSHRILSHDSADGEGGKSANYFITVNGTRFKKGQKNYYFTGANYWYGAYLGVTDDGRKQIHKDLDQLRSMGVTNLRILAPSDYAASSGIDDAANRISADENNESLLQGLDFLLAELARRKMHAVLYFNNFQLWSGEMSQYLDRTTNSAALNPDVTGHWNEFLQNSTSFYGDGNAHSGYQKTISDIVLRINSVNGVPYTDDPTIMAWQLANEPRSGNDAEGRPFFPIYKNWLSGTAAFIKSLDSNHLVSTGSEGASGTLGDIELYADAHNDPNIDYLTFHLWPGSWGWLDLQKPEESFRGALTKSRAYILQHIQVAQTLVKPIVLDEFGIERDHSGNGSATAMRDRFFKEIYQLVFGQARLGFPVAGSNFWGWGGSGWLQSQHLMQNPGATLMGNAPHESQYMHLVLDVDGTTIEIISQNAKVMNAL